MHSKIKEAIDELFRRLRIYSDDNVISFELFVNHQGTEIKITYRDKDELEFMNVSMKNIKGQWINIQEE